MHVNSRYGHRHSVAAIACYFAVQLAALGCDSEAVRNTDGGPVGGMTDGGPVGGMTDGGPNACIDADLETMCGDGVDDDCDGRTDCEDVECGGMGCGAHGLICIAGECICPGGVTEICGNGSDDDCDGSTDCEDVDCDGPLCRCTAPVGNCNVYDAGSCGPTHTCTTANEARIAECVPAGEGGLGDACDGDDGCRPGLVCPGGIDECRPYCCEDEQCPGEEVCNVVPEIGAGWCLAPNECDVVTQAGCEAGEGCYLMPYDGALVSYCATAGTAVSDCSEARHQLNACTPGSFCDPAHMDCLGWCDPETLAGCAAGETCQVRTLGSTSFAYCEPDIRLACDPVAQTGCPEGSACYRSDNDLLCSTSPGPGVRGDACTAEDGPNGCRPGLFCHPSGTCQLLCRDADDCPPNEGSDLDPRCGFKSLVHASSTVGICF